MASSNGAPRRPPVVIPGDSIASTSGPLASGARQAPSAGAARIVIPGQQNTGSSITGAASAGTDRIQKPTASTIIINPCQVNIAMLKAETNRFHRRALASSERQSHHQLHSQCGMGVRRRPRRLLSRCDYWRAISQVRGTSAQNNIRVCMLRRWCGFPVSDTTAYTPSTSTAEYRSSAMPMPCGYFSCRWTWTITKKSSGS